MPRPQSARAAHHRDATGSPATRALSTAAEPPDRCVCSYIPLALARVCRLISGITSFRRLTFLAPTDHPADGQALGPTCRMAELKTMRPQRRKVAAVFGETGMCTSGANRMAASVGLQSKELGRDSSLPLQDRHWSATLRSGSAQSAQRSKDRLQCAQSNDKFGYASLRSEEVTGGTKMKAWISVHSRTSAVGCTSGRRGCVRRCGSAGWADWSGRVISKATRNPSGQKDLRRRELPH
jgi:hypothetical protein